jgi:fatty acid desaturase
MGIAGIWGRLRDRKVAQWGLAYIAGAWGFLQGLGYVSDTFGWPGQIRQIVTLAVLIGLPLVLVLAWYHGDRGQQKISAPELVMITLLFMIGGGIFWMYERDQESGAARATDADRSPCFPSSI